MISSIDRPRMQSKDVVLDIRDVSKTFPGTRALDSVDFDLYRGEVHALVGQNGSGKSTMIKILAGFYQPDPGATFLLDGESVEIPNTTLAHDLGFRFVHQELGLVPTLDTVENLALSEGYPTGAGGRIKWRAGTRDARARIRALGYEFDVRRPAEQLTAAERAGIAIARALKDFESAKVLVLDEPTASLPRHEVSLLFDAVSRVRDAGLGVIYVSHRLDEIFQLADRVTPLRDGRAIGTYAASELDEKRLVSLMVGDIDLSPEIGPRRDLETEEMLSVSHLCGTVVDNVSFAVPRGEVLGLAGLTGSGRDEILRLIFGALPRHGEIVVAGGKLETRSPQAAMRAGVCFVPADRVASGAVVELTVRENLTMSHLEHYSRSFGPLSKSGERTATRRWIQELDITPPRTEAIFDSLSGGNQQKVMLAKWLQREPRVILLDDPTQGVDIGAKATIHALARKAAADGAAVVIASSDEAELCDVCDRILVMRDGGIIAELSGESVTPESIGAVQSGGASN